MIRKTTITAAFAMATVFPLVSASVAFACHPQGVITKTVQNITTNGKVSDANTAETAVSAKPGDVLRYTITVKNTASSGTNGLDDMLHTVMTDTLPTGVELVANASTHTITESFGTVAAGKSVSKSYDVKVTSTTDKAVIKNKACYTGDSKQTTKAQSGCDEADVVVNVPIVVTPVPTTPTVTPAATTVTVAQPQPTRLPNTGAGSNIALLAVGTSIMGYIASRLYLRRSS
jgi:uncharacterized repeat protein (TIGR01451 family)